MSMFIQIPILLFIVIGIIFSILVSKGEPDDEMSRLHRMKANSEIMFILQLVLSAAILFALRKDTWVADLTIILPIIIGVIKLLFFGLFAFYEKAGD